MKMSETESDHNMPVNETDSSIPAFLNKLWRMVNDASTDHLICWAPDGRSFLIQNEAGVWYELLPAYYKHNNMSSFVRQLNMYGFHKVSNTENNYMEHDRVEYQFQHPFFQRGRYKMLKNIKRKVSTSKGDKKTVQIENRSEMNRVLNDVKQLSGKQAQVDGLLANLKKENTVLWRELAILRQKHQKQQQILIQFLVTIVQPAARMGGLGVKRRYPLMLNENPQNQKKAKQPPADDGVENVGDSGSTTCEGPTIHELDSVEHTEMLPHENVVELQVDSSDAISVNPNNPSVTKSTSDLLEGVDLIDSPAAASEDKAEYINVEDLFKTDDSENLTNMDAEENVIPDMIELAPELAPEDQKVFLNAASQDAMLSDLVNGSYNTRALNNTGKADNQKKTNETDGSTSPNMMVATHDPPLNLARLNSADEIDAHLETTQNELDQLKEFFNGCNSFDSLYLMNLFNEHPSFGIPLTQKQDDLAEGESLASGTEVTPYGSGFVDFTELFDDTSSNPEYLQVQSPERDSVVNTPDITNSGEPTFPQPK